MDINISLKSRPNANSLSNDSLSKLPDGDIWQNSFSQLYPDASKSKITKKMVLIMKPAQ